ncbi:MAG: GntR family transcriptional regulator [Candidatus Avilachnospira sp.]|jgi:DNA-binding GntR family transcriptional regulator
MWKNNSVSLKDQVYTRILNDIIEGVYKPSEILNEKPLIEKYGVSKSPVRDALIELCKEGVLQSHPRYGYEIVTISKQEVDDIIKFRLILEPECLRQAAGRIDLHDLRELEEFTENSCRVTEKVSVWQHWENNKAFHLKLNSYCGNSFCCKALKYSMNILTRAYAQMQWDRWKTTYLNMDCEMHLKIVDCLIKGEVDTAVSELISDIKEFRQMAR